MAWCALRLCGKKIENVNGKWFVAAQTMAINERSSTGSD